MSTLPRSHRRAARGAALALTLLLAAPATGTALAAPAAADPGDIAVGDCFNSAADVKDYKTDEVARGPSSVDIVPCGQPHQSEAFAVVTLPEGPFPGDKKIISLANEKCGAKEVAAYAGAGAKIPDTMAVYFYLPTSATWDQGERRITCFLADSAGRTAGSVRVGAS
ncbi:septum formation family protein [Streptomyces sp. NPDC001389]|uniref:septum formation family protein n=1 Tax=unclassified Streptomyces TaxID=2593676 RepID=UPI00369C8B0D